MNLDMIVPCGRKDTPGKPVLYATTDNFLKRFKLKSLAELPDYEELMRRIAELNATDTEQSNYLYEKDVYNPDEDPDLLAADDETAATNNTSSATDTDGFELPDFLKDIQDGIIKIQ